MKIHNHVYVVMELRMSYNYLPGAKSFFDKLRWSRNSPPFMEPKRWLPC